jgi:tRNA(Ile)-lysidine synthase
VTEFDPALVLACGRHPVAHAVSQGLDRACVPAGARALVAVSGGADSTALLAACAGLRGRGRIDPVAGHVDHGLRAESPLEAECAGSTAARLGIAFVRRTLSLAPGSGVAARARDARYAALASMAREAGAGVVLLAHHADDQAETVLLALARGAGLAGIGGMPVRRLIEPGIDAVRPCLRVARQDLRAVCEALGLRWREDPTNDRRDVPRGRVRHAVLPELDAIAPGAARRIARAAEVARLGEALMQSHLEAMRSPDGSFARPGLRGAPPALAAAAIRMLAGDRLDDAAAWQAADAASGPANDPRRFPLMGGGELVVDAHAVQIRPDHG